MATETFTADEIREKLPEGYELFSADEAKQLREAAERDAELPETFTAEQLEGKLPEGHELLTTEQAEQLRTAAGNTDTFAQRLAKTEAKLEETDERLATAEFTEVFSQAKREGRVNASEETKAKWRERYDTLGREKTVELFNEIPAETIPVKERGIGGEAPEDETPDGVDPKAQTFHAKAEKLAGDEGITYEQAVTRLVNAGETF